MSLLALALTAGCQKDKDKSKDPKTTTATGSGGSIDFSSASKGGVTDARRHCASSAGAN